MSASSNTGSGQCPMQRLYRAMRVNPVRPQTPVDLQKRAAAWYRLLAADFPQQAGRWRARSREVAAEIKATGAYRHTAEELQIGAKMAWRHSIRCLGRYFWRDLDVFDAREATTARDIFSACVRHLRHATNKGNILSTMTIFAPEQAGHPGPRILNSQLIRYAGYVQPDGTIIGDPDQRDVTQQALKFGWRPRRRTRFDVLPLLIKTGEEPWQLFPLPPDAVMEVPLTHPQFDWFEALDLRWPAVPVISNMVLEIGGLRYPACPFNGWYMETEIGSRNLGDVSRYNLLPEIEARLGLESPMHLHLWKDRALVELNQAVLHSFKRGGVKIIDHHTATALHVNFERDEAKAGRPVTGLWSWLVPPMSGSATPIWNRRYDSTQYSPALLYHEETGAIPD